MSDAFIGGVASVLLGFACIFALWRMIKGPSILDRLISTDVILASMLTILAINMALTGRRDLLAVMIAIAMLGAVGSISVARYVTKSEGESASLGTDPASSGDPDSPTPPRISLKSDASPADNASHPDSKSDAEPADQSGAPGGASGGESK